jgi:FKBP-type peptidyl-prolyl cis-trans isomerase
MRKLPLILAAAALTALTLAGCSGSPAPSATPTAPGSNQAAAGSCTDTPEGDASKSIKVGGDAGAKATADFKAPLSADTTQRTVVTKGSGDKLVVGDFNAVNFTLFNGTSGKEITSTYDQGGAPQGIPVDETQYMPGLVKAIECAPAGSRVVAVVPPADGFGSQGNSSVGIAPTDSMVFVIDTGKSSIDMTDTSAMKASGADQPVVPGVPTVALAADGTPTITIPDSAPPAATTITVLKKGDGPVLGATQSAIVQYMGEVWGSKKVFDQSWGKTPLIAAPGGTVPGFDKAVQGQTIGSQVIVSMTPADGYGDQGQPDAGIAGTDTLVFVIDILAAA